MAGAAAGATGATGATSAAAAAAAAATAEQGLTRLCAFFETLTPTRLEGLVAVYAEAARFRDPFNDVRGLAGIRRIFDDMFERTRAPRFVITARVLQGQQAFVSWDFHFQLGQRALCIPGCSQLLFDAHGRVSDHRDYWDAAGELYVHLPWVGGLMRWLKRKLSAHGG